MEMGTTMRAAKTLYEAITSFPYILTFELAKALILSLSVYILSNMVVGKVIMNPGKAKAKLRIVMKRSNAIK